MIKFWVEPPLRGRLVEIGRGPVFDFGLIFEFWRGYERSWEWPESGCRIRQSLPGRFENLTYRLCSTVRGERLL